MKRFERVEKARALLLTYVKTAKIYYGRTFTVYNIHCVIHIFDDALFLRSSLQDFSALKNYLQLLKID